MIMCIIATQFTCGTLYLNIVSFYPLFVDTHYRDAISTFKVSVAMSAFQFAGVICTPIHAITISKMGRKNAMIIGTICMLIANTCLGMLALISYDKPQTFYICSLLVRFL